ncbi:MAG: hypothetical protein J6A22_09375 [Bacteroidales bacterium]|nr:hypothetical protein [Bacteroidales bacterium]
MKRMKTEQKFERLCLILQQKFIYGTPDYEFETICRSLELDPRNVNNLLYERFGMGGSEILSSI